MAWHQRGAVGATLGLVACCVLAGFALRGNSSETVLEQAGIVAPGIQVYEVPQDRRHRRQQLSFQSKAQVAMGNMGGSDGRWPIPPAPPPTWTRGGNTWVYDGIYGNGQRPTTGVWGPGKFPPSSPVAQPPPPPPPVEVVEEVTEPDGSKKDIIVPATEVVQPAAAAPAPAPVIEEVPQPVAAPAAAPVIEPLAAPVVQAPAPAPAVIEEIVKPDGKTEEVVVPTSAPAAAVAAPVEAAAVPAPAPAPAVEEECRTPNGPCQQIIVPAPVPTVMTSYIQSPPVAVPVPAPASAQLPMEWAAEDAAEHAYNLAQWRVKILKAKNDQAVLRKKLMELSMGTDQTGRRSGLRGRTKGATKELKEIKTSLLDLAKNTVDAIKDLKTQMEKLRKEQCCKNTAATAAHTSELSQLPGAITDKEKREMMVLKLKKRMDNQLDGLLKKVTTLIQSRQKH